MWLNNLIIVTYILVYYEHIPLIFISNGYYFKYFQVFIILGNISFDSLLFLLLAFYLGSGVECSLCFLVTFGSYETPNIIFFSPMSPFVYPVIIRIVILSNFFSAQKLKNLGSFKSNSKVWEITFLQCLYEAVKYNQGTLLDVYCETLDPHPLKSGTSSKQVELDNNGTVSSSARCLLGQHSCLQKCGSVCRAIRELR